MDNADNIIGIIPARAGSKRFPDKNRHLIDNTFNAVQNSAFIHKVVVTSDDALLLKKAWGRHFYTRSRPAVLSTSEASPVDVVLDTVDWMYYTHNIYTDTIMLLQPTSPLRTAQDIDEAISIFNLLKCDSLVSVSRVHEEPTCIIGEDGNFITDKKNLYFFINGAIYITKVSFLRENKCFYMPGFTKMYVMPKYRSIDVDDQEDWEMANFILEGIEHGKSRPIY